MLEVSDPAVARKRRKAVIQSQRSEGEHEASGTVASDDDSPAGTRTSTLTNRGTKEPGQRKSRSFSNAATNTTASASANCPRAGNNKCKKQKQLLSSSFDEGMQGKKKSQITYNPPPDVAMNKEQLQVGPHESRNNSRRSIFNHIWLNICRAPWLTSGLETGGKTGEKPRKCGRFQATDPKPNLRVGVGIG